MNPKIRQKEYEQALTDASSPVLERRAQGICGIGVFGTDKDRDFLKTSLKDQAEIVRVAALYALTLFGEKECVTKLIDYLGHSREQYRRQAKTAIEAVFSKTMTDPLPGGADAEKARKEWSDWWKANSAGLNWDNAKRKFLAK